MLGKQAESSNCRLQASRRKVFRGRYKKMTKLRVGLGRMSEPCFGLQVCSLEVM